MAPGSMQLAFEPSHENMTEGLVNRCILCPFHHQIVPGSGAKIALIHQTCSSSFKPCCEGENRVGGLQGFLLLLPTGWIPSSQILNMTPHFRVSRVSASDPLLSMISFSHPEAKSEPLL